MEKTPEDKFTESQIAESLKSLDQWTYDPEKIQIHRTYARKNFLDSVAFIQQIATLAEQQDHHPDILLFNYKNVMVMLSTHSAGGITQNDFDLARAIDTLDS